jgi:hypothetical protein
MQLCTPEHGLYEITRLVTTKWQCDVLIVFVPLSVGLAFGMAGSWAVIRSLRARVQLYQLYVHDRLDRQFKGTVTSVTQKPELIVRLTDTIDRIVYACSHCNQQFPFADNVSSKDAAARVVAEFREHVQQAHRQSCPF